MNKTQIKHGDIFYASLNPKIGSEQGDSSPVLVVQNDAGNTHNPTIVVVPIACKINNKTLLTHVILPQSCGLEHDSLSLVEQIRTIDRSRIARHIGYIGGNVQAEIDTALLVCVGIEKCRISKGEILVLTLCSRCKRDYRETVMSSSRSVGRMLRRIATSAGLGRA